jgi:hypothetical protein
MSPFRQSPFPASAASVRAHVRHSTSVRVIFKCTLRLARGLRRTQVLPLLEIGGFSRDREGRDRGKGQRDAGETIRKGWGRRAAEADPFKYASRAPCKLRTPQVLRWQFGPGLPPGLRSSLPTDQVANAAPRPSYQNVLCDSARRVGESDRYWRHPENRTGRCRENPWKWHSEIHFCKSQGRVAGKF